MYQNLVDDNMSRSYLTTSRIIKNTRKETNLYGKEIEIKKQAVREKKEIEIV